MEKYDIIRIIDIAGVVVFFLGCFIRHCFTNRINLFFQKAPLLYYEMCRERGYREGFAHYKNTKTDTDYNDIVVPSDLSEDWFKK